MRHLFLLITLLCASLAWGQQHTVNAVVGDSSWYHLQPKKDLSSATENERISTHLRYVLSMLRSKTIENVEASDTRKEALNLLEDYIALEAFPCNFALSESRRPCFIDDSGNICAVGYLLEQTAGRAEAERINSLYQYDFIADMKDAGLKAWQESVGLSMRELAMIQPAYGPPTTWTYYRDEKNEKIGIKNRFTHEPITKAIYDHLDFSYQRPMYSDAGSGENLTGIAMIAGKWGAISTTGASIVPLEYDTIFWVKKGTELMGNVAMGADRTKHLQAYLNKELQVFDYAGKSVFSIHSAKVAFQSKDLFILEVNGKQKFWHAAKRSFIGKSYSQIAPTYPRQPAGFIVTDQLQGFANTEGIERIPCTYDRFDALGEQYWICTKGTERKLHFADGTPVGLPAISWASFLEHEKPDKLHIQIGNLHGVYQVSSKRWLLDVEYDKLVAFSKNDQIWVHKGPFQGYFNLEGEVQAPPIYDLVNPTGTGFMVKKEGKMGLLRKKDQWTYPLEYDTIVQIGPYPFKVFALQKAGTWRLMKDDQTAFSSQHFSSFARLGGNRLMVGIGADKHWAQLESNGITVNTDFSFSSFTYGVQYTLIYGKQGKYGLWNQRAKDWYTTGKVTDPIFDQVMDHDFKNSGVFPVKYQGKYGVIDLEGRFVIEATFSAIDYSSSSVIYLKADDGWYAYYVGHELKKQSERTNQLLDSRNK